MNVLEARRRLLGAGVYKKTVTGNPAIAQGSLARMHPGIEMQGWTEQDSTTGAQLLDLNEMEIGGLAGSNGAEYNAKDRIRIGYVPVTAGIVYTLSGYGPYIIANSHTYDSSKSRIDSFSIGCEIPEGVAYVRVSFKKSDQSDFTEDDLEALKATIMFNSGSTALPYEPYTGGAPSPSPDYPQEIVSAGDEGEINVTVQGGNLLDADQYYEEYKQNNGTYIIFANEMGGIRIPITEDMLGKQYTFSASGIPALNDTFYVQYYENANKIRNGNTIVEGTSTFSQSKVTFIPEEMGGYIRLSHSRATDGTVQAKDIMLNVGASALPYEPYKQPQTVTLTSDRPLTKWDKLEKRNGQWGWVYKSAEIVLDGSEEWSLYAVNVATEGISFAITFDDGIGGFQTSLCDKYRNIDLAWGKEYKGKHKIYTDHMNRENKNRYFRPPSAEVETVEQWKAWLSENPLTVWYETAEETFVPLSASEQEQMNALHTFRPTTVLSNDCECNMSLTYKTKKSMVGCNPYGLEIGGIAGGGVGHEFEVTNRIRTDYIPFYSPDGSRTYTIVGNPYNIANSNAYDNQKNASGSYEMTAGAFTPPAGTWFIRISFSKPDNSDFTQEELNQLIRTFDIERS